MLNAHDLPDTYLCALPLTSRSRGIRPWPLPLPDVSVRTALSK